MSPSSMTVLARRAPPMMVLRPSLTMTGVARRTAIPPVPPDMITYSKGLLLRSGDTLLRKRKRRKRLG